MKHTISRSFVVFLAVLLFSSTIVMLGNSVVVKDSVEAAPLSPSKDYGNPLQYEWTTGGANENQTGFSAGPAPNTPDVLWKVASSASGVISGFDGKVFAVTGGGFGGGSSTLYAFNAFTGVQEWAVPLQRSAASSGGTTKIDDTYLFVDCNGPEVHRIDNGEFVANYTVPYYGGHPGSAQYFPGTWSSTLKMKFVLSYDMVTLKGLVNAISLADPTDPKLAWTYTVSEVSEIQGYGDGKLFVGTTANTLYALNATDGNFLWEAPKTGVVQQHGLFFNGDFYHAASSQTVTCWDGDTGEVKWEYDASELGERAYFAYRGAAAYGRYYDCAIPNYPHGWVVCWDALTGDVLWKQPAYYNIAYNTVAVADGKVYASKCDQAPGSVTAGLVMPGYALACFDAFTGTELWSIEGLNVATPSIAFGNLYFVTGGYLYCIGDSTPTSSTAKPWPFGYVGNLDQTRVAVGQSGPSDLSSPKWVYATDGKISGSPAVVDGKVYIGSDDHTWYCLDAYTGKQIWNFTAEYKIGSSAAVVGGKVFTGADDGYIYCLNAETGTQEWRADAGGLFKEILMPQELQSRSSPIVVGSKLYVGALDGKVYCLNIADGSEAWTYATSGPIGGSPIYSDGVIYITSTDTHLYALNANNGDFIWKSIGLNLGVGYGGSWPNHYFCTGTPVVANGVVYVPGGVTYGTVEGLPFGGGAFGGGMRLAAFDVTTGAIIWNQTLAGNSGGVWMPTYFNGNLYIPEHMRVSSMNASNPDSGPAQPLGFFNQVAGNRTWTSWIGYQILASVAYADDIRGAKVYIGSDVGSVSCLNATSGFGLSAYQTGANVEGSPTIWEGKLYIGGTDRNIYCFDNSPVVDFNIYAESNKGVEMWNNETISICGQLTANLMEMTWNDGVYVPIASVMHPGLPDATIELSLTKPDGSNVALKATTDNNGFFDFSYDPTDVGAWGWVVYYDGQRTTGLTYNAVNGQWNSVNVIKAPSGNSATPAATGTATPSSPGVTATPASTATPAGSVVPTSSVEPTGTSAEASDGLPVEYVYVAVVVVVVVVVVVGVYVFVRRGRR
ncbi:MAG: PQQ-binding-like beta-propeller repeat protein [Candidatus Bathyarchaeota archaeon]|nr:PQQ-binding-like beta-propeller repeat protein [Candidatus Bathyarchaeota archaeon]